MLLLALNTQLQHGPALLHHPDVYHGVLHAGDHSLQHSHPLVQEELQLLVILLQQLLQSPGDVACSLSTAHLLVMTETDIQKRR